MSSNIKRQPKPQLLYEENREKFNTLKNAGKIPHLRCQNMCDLDLRGFDFSGLDLRGSYMRRANISGCDFTGSCLDGVSLRSAKVSGCLFPRDLSPEEIRLSLEFGTRLRHNEQSICACLPDEEANDSPQ